LKILGSKSEWQGKDGVQVDAMMGAAKEGGHLQKLLSVHTRPEQRQTILASATIPQHRRFLQDCIQNKWTKVV
jgi:hypothetical protein